MAQSSHPYFIVIMTSLTYRLLAYTLVLNI